MVQLKQNEFTYEEAVARLNALQSNVITLQKIRKKREVMQGMNLAETLNYLKQLDIKLEDIDRLNPIHVSGTKGKGSTCAFVECILRHLGFKTGFYSSPHLIHVRERIKINGVSLTEAGFAEYFLAVYNLLQKNNAGGGTMPAYFKFLTLMAFYVFVKENVDVAIIEVGIGGEHDCTNIIKNPVVCGVTTLDLDHTSLLGSTLKEIAWQKAGIFKPESVAIVADQTEDTMEVFYSRAVEKNCVLHVAPPLEAYKWPSKPFKIGIAGKHQHWNISLALQLTKFWLERTGNRSILLDGHDILPENHCSSCILHGFTVPTTFIYGLRFCVWPGRSQVVKVDSTTYFIDGAHTPKSLQCCVEWYLTEREHRGKYKVLRVLVFHCTADRSPESLLPFLKDCGFDAAVFCPAQVYPTIDEHSDQTNYNQSRIEEMLKVKRNSLVWKTVSLKTSVTKEFDCISKAFEWLESFKKTHETGVEVLVTGSLHLVGGFLSLLEAHS